MAMTGKDWGWIATGAAAVIMAGILVHECSGKREAESLNREAATALDSLLTVVDGQKDKIDELNREADEIDQENIALRDSVAARDARIISLQDSLAICKDAKDCPCKPGVAPCDCKKSSGNCCGGASCTCCKKTAKKTTPKKSGGKSTPAKPAAPKKEECVSNKPAVEVKSGDKEVRVNGQQNPGQSVIINGDNNGNVIVNNNGNVEANGNVNGHDNNVNSNAAAAAKKQQDLLRQYAGACAVERVRCH